MNKARLNQPGAAGERTGWLTPTTAPEAAAKERRPPYPPVVVLRLIVGSAEGGKGQRVGEKGGVRYCMTKGGAEGVQREYTA